MPSFLPGNQWRFKKKENPKTVVLGLRVTPQMKTEITRIKNWQEVLREEVFPQMIRDHRYQENLCISTQYKLFIYYCLRVN